MAMLPDTAEAAEAAAELENDGPGIWDRIAGTWRYLTRGYDRDATFPGPQPSDEVQARADETLAATPWNVRLWNTGLYLADPEHDATRYGLAPGTNAEEPPWWFSGWLAYAVLAVVGLVLLAWLGFRPLSYANRRPS